MCWQNRKKAKGWYIKKKKYDYIGVEYFDEEQDFKLFLDFLKKISNKKVVFVEMSDLTGFSEKEFSKKYMKSYGKYRALLSTIGIEVLDKQIFENRYVHFYIYESEKAISWKEYLNSRTINVKKEIGSKNLYSMVGLCEETIIDIFCQNQCVQIKEFVNILNGHGYRIKEWP